MNKDDFGYLFGIVGMACLAIAFIRFLIYCFVSSAYGGLAVFGLFCLIICGAILND